MKILIVSDAWEPQVNGVVRTLQATKRELEKAGHKVEIVGPDLSRFFTFAIPFYREIAVELFSRYRLTQIIRVFDPDTIHIATEGPLGWAARSICLHNRWKFTTAYHTNFPQYCAARVPKFLGPLAEKCAYLVLKRFHAASSAVMVATGSVERELRAHGIAHLVRWSRGVDTVTFNPGPKECVFFEGMPRPILLYVGRVSVEKNLEAFLDLHTVGTKVVIGSGPDMAQLKAHYPEARFLGRMERGDLAKAYAAADLFVFPSISDTFGLVLLEACASGLRIAALPVSGPLDVLGGNEAGKFTALDDNLQVAVDKALSFPESPSLPRRFAEKHAWNIATAQFLEHLVPITSEKG